MAIEGGLDMLGETVASGDVNGHERMTRAMAAEIGRLRRMLSEAKVAATPPQVGCSKRSILWCTWPGHAAS